jgi:hypothetical protein
MFCNFQFLTKEARKRLGSNRDARVIRRDPFFNKIDLEAVENKRLKPPLEPQLRK